MGMVDPEFDSMVDDPMSRLSAVCLVHPGNSLGPALFK